MELRSKKRVKAGLCAVIAAVFMLCGCGRVVVQKEAAKKAATGDSWTIMIYMCGSTLEEDNYLASEVLSSLSYDLPENINVLVETGGSRDWETEDIYPDYIQDFVVQKNGIRMVNQRQSANMGEDTTLCRFIEWASGKYPAQHYITVIWDHGGGPVGGVAYDSVHGFDSLSLRELSDALADSGLKHDIIGFDASFTSNVETAGAVALYADYMVASEDVMPVSGWDYKSLFEFLSENPSATAGEVGIRICDDAAEAAKDEDEFLSMAVTDLANQTMLSLAVDGEAQAISACDEDIAAKRTIENLMGRLQYLGGNSQWEGYSNIVDVRQLAQSTRTLVGSPSDNLAAAVDAAVIYKRTGTYHNGLSGMGIYLPSCRAGANVEQYAAASNSESYTEFLKRSYTDEYASSGAHMQYDAFMADNAFSATLDLSGNFVLNATHPEIIKDTGVTYYMYNAKSGKYIYLYRDHNVTYMPADSSFKYTVGGKVPQLNGTTVSIYLVSRCDGYDIYSIPIIKNGEPTNIRVAKSAAGKYTVLGLWKGIGKFTGIAERYVGKLKMGDVITPIYEVYGESSRYIEGSDIRIGLTGKVNIEDKRPADSTYVISYMIEDLYGNIHESDTATMLSEKGSFKFSAN